MRVKTLIASIHNPDNLLLELLKRWLDSLLPLYISSNPKLMKISLFFLFSTKVQKVNIECGLHCIVNLKIFTK